MSSVTLAVDIHGGDSGISHNLEAVKASVLSLPENVNFILCGDQDLLVSEISNKRLDSYLESGRFLIENSTPHESIAKASRLYRDAPNSSLVRSIALQSEGKADVSLSAGDTGALYSSALFILGKQDNIERPALGATFPASSGGVVLILDVGANLECRAQHLVDFGKIGSAFMANLAEKKAVSVGLLNVGHEEHKGPAVIQEAHQLLKESSLFYNGYIEGNRVLTGDSDVVVCNGFTGNALLKLSEGMFRFVKSDLADHLDDCGRSRLDCFDSELHGAVPILGIKGSVFKAHGGSSVQALTNAITTAVKTVYLMKKNG